MSNEEFLKNNFKDKKTFNGRVDIMSKQPPNPLFLQDKIPANTNSFHNSLNGIQETSNLSNAFFFKSKY